jgi:hypothetical protein
MGERRGSGEWGWEGWRGRRLLYGNVRVSMNNLGAIQKTNGTDAAAIAM